MNYRMIQVEQMIDSGCWFFPAPVTDHSLSEISCLAGPDWQNPLGSYAKQ